jgi:hypothetical protein
MMTDRTRPAIVRLDLDPVTEGWLLSFACADRAGFERVLGAVRSLPLAARGWRESDRCWWIRDDWIDDLCWALPDLHRRLIDARHHDQQAWQRRGTRSQPPPPGEGVPAPVEEAFATLYLLPSAPEAVVCAVKRVLSRQHHPDAGGNPRAMVAINQAADTAKAWAAKHRRESA